MKIERKDGVIYERKPRKINNETNICMRISGTLKEKLRNIALDKQVSYQTLIKNVLENYVNNYKVETKE